jgi:hypothetical protein
MSVFHVDQPSNDFNALFEVLDVDPDRYVLDEPNVFPAAIGRSFYESVLPPGSVHLGWCSYAAVFDRTFEARDFNGHVSKLQPSRRQRKKQYGPISRAK